MLAAKGCTAGWILWGDSGGPWGVGSSLGNGVTECRGREVSGLAKWAKSRQSVAKSQHKRIQSAVLSWAPAHTLTHLRQSTHTLQLRLTGQA